LKILHNLIGVLKNTTKMPQRPLSRLGSKDPRVTTFLLSLPRITVENPNLCTKCNGKNTTKMLKSFSLKFQQSYKSYWGNKRGRTKEFTKNTKIKI